MVLRYMSAAGESRSSRPVDRLARPVQDHQQVSRTKQDREQTRGGAGWGAVERRTLFKVHQLGMEAGGSNRPFIAALGGVAAAHSIKSLQGAPCTQTLITR